MGRRIFFEYPNRLYTINLAQSTFSNIAFPSCCPPLLFAAATPVGSPMLSAHALALLLLALASCALFALRVR